MLALRMPMSRSSKEDKHLIILEVPVCVSVEEGGAQGDSSVIWYLDLVDSGLCVWSHVDSIHLREEKWW